MEKITNPGRKNVYRIYDRSGHAVADLITHDWEQPDLSVPYRCIDPKMPWKDIVLRGCTVKPLLRRIIENGKKVYLIRDIKEIRDYVEKQLREEIWPEEQRFENPHVHHMDMSPDYYESKMRLLKKESERASRNE